jgi:hypothetical protein
MARTVVLHVGVMKSGTTFVQGQLFANRSSLAERDILVLGRKWADQVEAVKDSLRPLKGGSLPPDSPWSRMAAEARDWAGTSIVSMEFLGPAAPDRIRRIVDSLRPARVEVVVTARDLNRSIVALWQETIQNGRWWTWQEYVDGVRAASPGQRARKVSEAGRTFWRQQDLVRICRAWSAAADQCTLVTVPHPGASRTELLDRFARAAGLGDVELRKTGANESIGAASTLALREMNELLAGRDLAFPHGAALRKGVLAKQVLAGRRDVEPSIGLPVHDWVTEASARLVARLRELDLPLVGDWHDLEPVAVPGVDPADIGADQVAAAAIAGLAGLVETRIGH